MNTYPQPSIPTTVGTGRGVQDYIVRIHILD